MTPTDREPVHVHRHGADPLRVEPVEYHEPLDGKRPRVWLVAAVLIVFFAVLFVTQVALKGENRDGVLVREHRSDTSPAMSTRQEAATQTEGSSGIRAVVRRDEDGRGEVGQRGPRIASALPETDTVGIAPAATGLRGWATYYDVGSGNAAAGPALRQALGGDPAFRGESVRVCASGRCLTTRLTDWCACGPRHGQPTLIDLARADFARLAPTSRGVLLVTIDFDAPSSTLPPTSTEEGP